MTGEAQQDGPAKDGVVESRQMAEFLHVLDHRGRIKRWPKRFDEKKFVLELLQSKFVRGRAYSEKEVNDIIREWHLFDDHALLRREMVDRCLVNRTNDGRKYWI